jgi:Uma2 family endonuclease
MSVELKPWAVQDYYSLPEEGVKHQLIQGEIVLSPGPNRKHQKILVNLLFILSQHIRLNQLGEIDPAPFDLELDEHNVLQPDLVFFSKRTLHYLADQGTREGAELVIEILSESTAGRDHHVKPSLYSGVGIYDRWIVDPDSKSLEVYHLDENPNQPTTRLMESDSFESRLFPGLLIGLDQVFE